jgi:hypothetical protein
VEVGTGALATAGLEGEGVPLSAVVDGESPDHEGPLPPLAGAPRIQTRNVAMKSLFTPREYTKSKTEAFIRVILTFENYKYKSIIKKSTRDGRRP